MIDLQAQPQLKHLVINLGPTFFTSSKNSCGKHARDQVNFEIQHWCHMIHMFNEHLKKDHEENGSTFKKKDT